jgi:hypothetical protein
MMGEGSAAAAGNSGGASSIDVLTGVCAVDGDGDTSSVDGLAGSCPSAVDDFGSTYPIVGLVAGVGYLVQVLGLGDRRRRRGWGRYCLGAYSDELFGIIEGSLTCSSLSTGVI